MKFKYDPTFPIRGLYYDRSKGCLLKLDFFGSIEPDGCYFGHRKVLLINYYDKDALFSFYFLTIITMHFSSTSHLSTSGLMGNITNDSSYFYRELLTKWGVKRGGGVCGGLFFKKSHLLAFLYTFYFHPLQSYFIKKNNTIMHHDLSMLGQFYL